MTDSKMETYILDAADFNGISKQLIDIASCQVS